MNAWTGLACGTGCGYAVLSPDTMEGVRELMCLHMIAAHPEIERWFDDRGVMHKRPEI